MEVLLKRFSYKYMEYEEFFLSCELEKFFPSSIIKKKGNTIVLSNVAINELVHLRNLTYIESFCVDNRWENTLQGDLESEHSGNNKRAAERPSEVVGSVPFGEGAEAGADGDFRGEAVVAFQRFGVGVGDGDIAGLHADKLAVGLKVVI